MKKRTIATASIAIVLMVGVFFVGIVVAGKFAVNIPSIDLSIENTTEIDIKVVEESVRAMSELVTLSYGYTNVGELTDQKMVKIFGSEISLPFGKKSFIIAYDGEMKIGVNMAQVSIDMLDMVILVSVPDAYIISHTVYEDTIVVYDEKNGLFNKITITDYSDFVTEQKALMVDKAVAAGRMEQAKVNAKTQIEAFVFSFLDKADGYAVRFVDNG